MNEWLAYFHGVAISKVPGSISGLVDEEQQNFIYSLLSGCLWYRRFPRFLVTHHKQEKLFTEYSFFISFTEKYITIFFIAPFNVLLF